MDARKVMQVWLAGYVVLQFYGGDRLYACRGWQEELRWHSGRRKSNHQFEDWAALEETLQTWNLAQRVGEDNSSSVLTGDVAVGPSTG